MWELSICVTSNNIDIAKFIYQTLKLHCENYCAVVTCYEQFDNFFILWACPNELRNKANDVIEDCVIKVVCNFYKDRYLTKTLHLPIHENISMTAFKKALINFDKETDIFLISKYLKLDKNLHLDSFYNFKLKPLRDKWSELVMLANENGDYLTSQEAFFDLLRFLIDNLEVMEDEINVFEEEDGFHIKTKSAPTLSKEALVSNLIELCPKRINFFCKNDASTAGFLSKIFEERVNVCYNKNLEKLDKFSVLK